MTGVCNKLGVAASVVATDLSHAYGKGAARTSVLNKVSVQFWPGELTLVMGASGSGKSTLLAILGGLLRPNAGQVCLVGTNILSLAPRALEKFRYQQCGYIFQGFNLFPALRAVDQVALPLCFGGESSSRAVARAEAALEEVGLIEKRLLRPSELSGGEKQRVAIARALVTQPKVLFADEPTSALDSSNNELVIALLQKIARVHQATVIVVTHDPRLMRHAERILNLHDGALFQDHRTTASSTPLTFEGST